MGTPQRAAMTGMAPRFNASGGEGYALVHFRSAIWVAPASRAAVTASSISASVAIPVEITMGFPVAAIRRTSGRSTSSNEATL
jgi:hypothetical protein